MTTRSVFAAGSCGSRCSNSGRRIQRTPGRSGFARAHDALDAAVAAAYGWSAEISDDDILRGLLALNGGGPGSG